MKRTILPGLIVLCLMSCNNSKENKPAGSDTSTSKPATTENSNTSSSETPAGSATVAYSVDGKDINIRGSVLVQKDKSKLSAGNDLFAMVTANGPDKNTFTLNFLFTPKPGSYPVVGLAFSRDLPNGKGEVYGGILGGEPKMTTYKVNLTQCENMGENGMGGHKWKISGNVEGDVTIGTMNMMKLNKEHPESIKLSNVSFANLSFDDNWEEMMEKGMEQMKKKKAN